MSKKAKKEVLILTLHFEAEGMSHDKAIEKALWIWQLSHHLLK